MARGINKVILIGNCGADPETRYLPNGGAVTNINIATSESWKDKESGQQNERTEWHRIVVWSKLAELCGEYLSKGRQVYVEGKLQTRQWEDRDGNKRYTTEVQAREITFLGGRGEGGQGGSGGQGGGGSRRPSGGGAGSAGGGAAGGGGGAGAGAGGNSDPGFDYGPPPMDDDDGRCLRVALRGQPPRMELDPRVATREPHVAILGHEERCRVERRRRRLCRGTDRGPGGQRVVAEATATIGVDARYAVVDEDRGADITHGDDRDHSDEEPDGQP